jgi:NAD(P)-dependent dehydrogenase (short-subunit alcohol dehydrogenase family)
LDATLNFNLDGRTAIVTGGSTGIGLGIARGFAEAGANVVIAARRPEVIDQACHDLSDTGRTILGIPTDVSDAEQVARLVAQTQEKLGRIDVLVNNAGGTFGPTFRRAPLLDTSDHDFQECWAINVQSAFMCSKAVASQMMKQGNGSIINISSISGREAGAPLTGFSVYGAVKAALIQLTRGMAAEWGPSIRANVIAAGMIDTPRVTASRSDSEIEAQLLTIAMGRAGLPADVAGAAVFFASEAASWITGACLDVHGGLKRPYQPKQL